MEPYIDKEIEQMLERAGKALTPGRVRFQELLQRSKSMPAHSQLSPLTISFFMNTTGKVMAVLAAVVVVGGGALYFSTSSSAPGPVAENDTTFAPPKGPGDSTQPADSEESVEQTPTSPLSPASLALAAIDEVNASLQSDLSAQSSAIGTLDASANQTVSLVDTANSSKQPYDENSI